MRYRWLDKDRETMDEMGIPSRHVFEEIEDSGEKTEEKLYTRGELTSITLTTVIMLYSVYERDLPVAFLTASVLLFMLSRLASFMDPAYADTVGNLMRGFSIGLFFGAVFSAFM